MVYRLCSRQKQIEKRFLERMWDSLFIWEYKFYFNSMTHEGKKEQGRDHIKESLIGPKIYILEL